MLKQGNGYDGYMYYITTDIHVWNRAPKISLSILDLSEKNLSYTYLETAIYKNHFGHIALQLTYPCTLSSTPSKISTDIYKYGKKN